MICSNPLLFNTLFCVNKVSFPTLLNVGGPITTTDDVIPPAVFWWTNIHWSFEESNNSDPLRSGDEPESITASPPRRTPGVFVLTVMRLVSTLRVLCEI